MIFRVDVNDGCIIMACGFDLLERRLRHGVSMNSEKGLVDWSLARSHTLIKPDKKNEIVLFPLSTCRQIGFLIIYPAGQGA